MEKIIAGRKKDSLYDFYETLPAGKRQCKPLRESENEIQKALNDEVAYHGGDVTVFQLMKRYIFLKTGVRFCVRMRIWRLHLDIILIADLMM
ncbi:MAG: hypothetical protein K2K70_04260 [Lachnospiraceae bacterium]|nr:hypothetical protein [Lachnospiraceae bacterium]